MLTGIFFSFDVSNDVGGLLRPAEQERWSLRIVDRRNRKASFLSGMAQLGSIDIFIHDSDHSYGWQMLEFRTAHRQLRPVGIVVADDVHTSFAFLDFCRSLRLRPVVLFDGLGLGGFLRCGSPTAISTGLDSARITDFGEGR